MPSAIATSGFTYWCVTTSEIGATRRSQAYAEKPTSEPMTTRYAQASTESSAKVARAELAVLAERERADERGTRRRVPSPTPSRRTGRAGARAVFERNDPVDQDIVGADHHREPERRRPVAEPGCDDEEEPGQSGERAQAGRPRGTLAARAGAGR